MSRTALEGERKQVTVLFADLTGSMELLAGRDPEDAREILDPVLEQMIDAVHRYEGTVNQVMGDGIMALFGAPLAHEDHAVRACYAALRMQESVKRYADQVHRREGVPLQIRVGLNSGEVVVRSIGSDLHMDYTAVGQTTHLAARMEQMAMPGSILAAPETLALADGYVVARPLGQRPVKGLQSAIDVYEIVGTATIRSRLHVAAARGLTRFVGRHGELDTLGAALARARAGHGQIVAVVGEPGVGKSRLVWELTHSHRMSDWLILESNAVSYGRTTSYLPVIDLLRAYFKILDLDEHREIREKVTGKLLGLDRFLEPSLPAVLGLLDVPVDDDAWEALAPSQRRHRTLDAVRRLLARESQVQPVLLILEDLQWIDSETQALLDRLVETLPLASILLLVSYRPEYGHQWASKSYYTQLRVDSLPRDGASEMLEALLGTGADLQPLKKLLVEKTDGNPFFLEESVRTLLDAKVLVGDRGARRATRPIESIQVPATVQAVLAARIDRLPPEDKRLLQSAAVIGKDVPFAILEAIAELPEDELRRRLQNLQSAEVLYETGFSPTLEYTFKHAVTHEVAYASVLHDRRRALHAAITGAIEQRYPGRLIEQVERLAHHAFRGELWEAAVTYLRQAGLKASARSAHREAAGWFEQALTALDHLPASRSSSEHAIAIRIDLRNALMPVGEVERVLHHLREAARLAESLNDRRRGAWISGYTSAAFWSLGAYTKALESAQHTRAVAHELGDRPLGLYANLALGWTYHSLGRYGDGARCGGEALQMLATTPGSDDFGIPSLPAVIARSWLALSLAERGALVDALAHAQEATRLAEAVGEPWSLVSAHLALGGVALQQGNVAAAVSVLERGLDVSRRFNIDVWFPPLGSSLGHAYARSGRVSDAVQLLTRAVEQATTTGLRFYHSRSMIWLGEALLLSGREKDAEARAAAALPLCEAHDERGNEAYARLLLGEIAAAGRPDLTHAERYYREALAIASELDMRPLVERCQRALARLTP